MTDFGKPGSAADAPGPKAPAPDLSLRAPRPPVVRLRRSVVQVVVLGGAILVSGSLAWAFVVQPELRAGAQARAAEKKPEQGRGLVRPTEIVTRQPSSYDRLPEPRGVERLEATVPSHATGPASASSYPSQAYRSSPVPRSAGASASDQAARSALFFDVASSGRSPAGPTGPTASDGSDGAGANGGRSGAYNENGLVAPLSPFELKAGAVVPAALLTGVDTARPGPVVAMVTQNVFDTVSGRHLLIPQGTRLIGRHEGESAYGDRRAFLVWDRLILPNGKSLILDSEPGVDAQGTIGVRGLVDRRLFPLLVGTLFAGALTTLGQMARDDSGRNGGGWLGDAGDAAAIEGAQVGGRLVDRELEVRPSIRLRAGAPVHVMITRDLVLEPYTP
ncbi:TrbI/VirB10 family protein [Brevundimonas diminuta]|uniref:TrbI/VirB10 family protein n=1 Tax=Brevundimonas diminuta TaxID=293 RepID=UPI000B363EA8|nr:TrbI/VirB10 family protein [Brevundimonas diminuta]